MARDELLEELNKKTWDNNKNAVRLGAARNLLRKCHEGEEGYDAERAIRDEANRAKITIAGAPLQPDGERYFGFLEWIEWHRNKVYGKKPKS